MSGADVDLAHEWRPAEGSAGSTVPVVLLHAFPLDRSLWEDVLPRLRALDVLVVDLPGFGGTPVPGCEPDLDVCSEALARLLDGTGHTRAVLAGVSLGGYVAMAFARRHRDRVAGIALVDTKADADTDEARAHRERVATAVTGEAGIRALAPMKETLLGATTLATRADLVDRVRGWVENAPVEGVAWMQRAMAARPDSFGTLRGLRVPAAVVVGEEDVLSPPESARAMAEALHDAVLSVVPGCGHLTPLENPDAFTAALVSLVLRVRVYASA